VRFGTKFGAVSGPSVSIDSLPYMVFLLLVEFTAGCLWVTYLLQLRGLVTHGFVKMGAATALASGVLTAGIATAIDAPAEVGGYPLDGSFLVAARSSLWALLVLLAIYAGLVWREREPAGRSAGALSSVLAVGAVALAAGMFRLPAWSYFGVLLSLMAGAASLGAVTMGMVLGHWYLVTPRLPEQPLNETTLALAVVLVLQTLLLVVNLFIPVRQVPIGGEALGLALLQNPAFWLRIGVGLLFPIVLAVMAWRSSLIRGMMSATGLLYVATGAVLAGEALARGLQLVTAIPF
jgi:hypothetical protein